MRDAFGELESLSDRPEYRNRDAKLDLLTKQNLDGCLLFPTLGVGMESALENDLPALQAAFSAFNRWLAEDWVLVIRTVYLPLRTSLSQMFNTRSLSLSLRLTTMSE